MKLIILIIYLFMNSVTADPEMKNYSLSINGVKCALLSISANLSVDYETKEGTKTVNLSLGNEFIAVNGVCSSLNKTNVQFNMKINKNEKLVFDFKNIDNEVFLEKIMFMYYLPSVNFPNSTNKGIVVASSQVNKYLSKSYEFFQCLENRSFKLTNNVTFTTFSVKLKVFNVSNGSFGDKKSECRKTPRTTKKVITTRKPTTRKPTTRKPTTRKPTTRKPTTRKPTTRKPTTRKPTTGITTKRITTRKPTTRRSTTRITTKRITTRKPTRIPTASQKTLTTRKTTVSPKDTKFFIKNGTNICLLLQGEMSLSVTYKTYKKKDAVRIFNIPSDLSKYDGICSTNEDNITIHIASNVNFTLSFTKTGKKFKLNSFKSFVFLSPNFFPDAKDKIINQTYQFGSTYELYLGKSYSCERNETLVKNSITLYVSDLKFEAFRISETKDFSNEVTTCFKRSIVGIVVGVILAVLIILTIIGYSTYRIREKRKLGYQELK